MSQADWYKHISVTGVCVLGQRLQGTPAFGSASRKVLENPDNGRR
jgi:hypothetical protein